MKNQGPMSMKLILVLTLITALLCLPGCLRPSVEIYYSVSGGFAPVYYDLSISMEGLAVYEQGISGEPLFRISDTIPADQHMALYRLFLSVGFNGFDDAYPYQPGNPVDLPTAEITIVDHALGTSKTVTFYMWPENRPKGLWDIKNALEDVADQVKNARLFTYELAEGSVIAGSSCPDCDDFNFEALFGSFTLVELPSAVPEEKSFEIIWLSFYSPNVYTVWNNWDGMSRIALRPDEPGAVMEADLFVNGFAEKLTGDGEYTDGWPAPESFLLSEVACGWVGMTLNALRVENSF